MQGDLYRFGGSKTERFFLRGVAKTREKREGGGKEGMRRGVGESDDRPCFTERLQSSGGNSVEAATVRGGGKVVPGEFGQPA